MIAYCAGRNFALIAHPAIHTPGLPNDPPSLPSRRQSIGPQTLRPGQEILSHWTWLARIGWYLPLYRSII